MTTPHLQDDGLLPCPFCGPGNSMVDPWFDDVSKRWTVGCGRCGASCGRSVHAEGSKDAAIKSWNTRATPASRNGAEGTGENLYMPTYGKLPWDQLGRDVMEAICGQRLPFKFTAEGYPGHEMAGINFNSLARIVDKYRLATPPKPAPDALRADVLDILRTIEFGCPQGRCPYCLGWDEKTDAGRPHVHTPDCKLAAALSPAPVPPADGVGEQLKAAHASPPLRGEREAIARAVWLNDYPESAVLFDRFAARGFQGDTGEAQAMIDKTLRRADAVIIALQSSPVALSDTENGNG